MPLTEAEELELLELEEAEASAPDLKGNAILEKLGDAASAVDSYTGAPIRAGIGSLQTTNNGLGGAVDAARNQFGKSPGQAPTGQQIARNAGFSDTSLSDVLPEIYSDSGEGLALQKGGWADPTASGTAGAAINVVTDPMSYLPVGKALGVGEKLGEVAGPPLAKGAGRVGEALTGVPKREIETYLMNRPAINKRIANYGDDIATAADDTRRGFASDIKVARQGFNKQIDDAIATAPHGSFVKTDNIISALNTEKLRLNKSLNPKDIAEIDGIIAKVRELAPDGAMDLKTAFEVKNYLQDLADSAYAQPGQIFTTGDKAARAAKSAAFHARIGLNEVSPQIAEANKRLSMMHTIEKRMNKNLIKEGGSEAALLSAGGGNIRNRNMLESLGDLTGKDMVSEADMLAAQKRFASPDYLPVDSTGKSFTRIAAGSALGSVAGGPVGSMAGLASTSPAAVKAGINIGATAGNVAKSYSAMGAYSAGMAAERQSQTMDINYLTKKVSGHPNASKYTKVLNSAAQSGGQQSVAATHYVMSQQDPEYAKAVSGSED